MACLAVGNEHLIEQLRAKGDALSVAAANEIERLLTIWDANNEIFAGLFEHYVLVQVSEPDGIQGC